MYMYTSSCKFLFKFIYFNGDDTKAIFSEIGHLNHCPSIWQKKCTFLISLNL